MTPTIFMQELIDTHPETARLVNFGRSAEGRDILGLTISTGEDESEKKMMKKGVEEAEREVWLRDPRCPLASCTRGTLIHVLVISL